MAGRPRAETRRYVAAKPAVSGEAPSAATSGSAVLDEDDQQHRADPGGEPEPGHAVAYGADGVARPHASGDGGRRAVGEEDAQARRRC